jgi:ATP-dependent HslUV protease, peptidase subunit HslV
MTRPIQGDEKREKSVSMPFSPGEQMMNYHGTTILAVRKNGTIAVAGDGQVTLNDTVIKHHAKKVRKIYNDQIIVGFAGATADAFNLV